MSDKKDLLAEAIRRGAITVSAGADMELVKEITEYNRQAADSRRKMKLIDEIGFGFMLFNPLVVYAVTIVSLDVVFRNTLTSVIFILYSVLFVISAIVRKNMLLATLISVILLVIDIRFGILLAADVVLCVLHWYMDAPLKNLPGYPNFFEVHINYE